MKFAMLQASATIGQYLVTEVVEAPRVTDGVTFQLSELYHPDIVLRMRQCPASTAPGDIYDLAANKFTAAPVQAAETDTGNGEPPPK